MLESNQRYRIICGSRKSYRKSGAVTTLLIARFSPHHIPLNQFSRNKLNLAQFALSGNMNANQL